MSVNIDALYTVNTPLTNINGGNYTINARNYAIKSALMIYNGRTCTDNTPLTNINEPL